MISPISMTNYGVGFTGKVNRAVYDYNPNDPTMARMPRTIKASGASAEPVSSNYDPSRDIKIINSSNGIFAVHPLRNGNDWKDEYGVTGIPVVIDDNGGDYGVTEILTDDQAVEDAMQAGANVGYIPFFGPAGNIRVVSDITIDDARKMVNPDYDRHRDIGLGKTLLAQRTALHSGSRPIHDDVEAKIKPKKSAYQKLGIKPYRPVSFIDGERQSGRTSVTSGDSNGWRTFADVQPKKEPYIPSGKEFVDMMCGAVD